MCVIILQYIIKINYCNRFIHFERGKRNNKSDGCRMLIRYNFRELVFLQNYAEELRRTYVKLPRVISSILALSITLCVLSITFLISIESFFGPVRFGNDAAMIKEIGDELNRTVIETAQYTGMPLRFREKLILSDSQTAECSKKMISNFRAMNDKVIEPNTVYEMLDYNVNGVGYSSKDKEYWTNVKVKFRNNLNEYVEAKKSQMQISGMQHFYQFLSTISWAGLFVFGSLIILIVRYLSAHHINKWRLFYGSGLAMMISGGLLMTIALFFSLGDTAFGIGDLLYVREICFSMVIMTWVRLQWMFSAMLIILGFVIFMTSRIKIESLLSHYRFDR
jgi:hypothetical protein